jgi:hypothetical protein
VRTRDFPRLSKRGRGFRQLLLHRLPGVWVESPQTRQLVVRSLEPPPTLSRDCAWERLGTSPDACAWSAACNTYELHPWSVACTTVDLGDFSVNVLGVTYRNRQRTEDRLTDVPPTNRGTATEDAAAPAICDRTRERHPYARLYDLLYPPPDDFIVEQIASAAELRPYQKEGINFLVTREHALLADDMGLGKTAHAP